LVPLALGWVLLLQELLALVLALVQLPLVRLVPMAAWVRPGS
jgi:hypothetical protein